MDSKSTGTEERRVTGRGGNPPGQGPFIFISLTLGEGVIREATYETYQCPACHACGRAICELARGRGLQEARKITWDTVAEKVGPLPAAKRQCYSLALLALSDALDLLEKN